MNKEEALVRLLRDLFTSQESLKRFVYSLPTQDSSIPRALGASSTELMALWFVDELRRRGLVDNRFFSHLIDEQPEQAERIRAVQRQWLVESDEWARPPSSETLAAGRADAPTVLVSYARNDAAFFEEISAHLSLLQRKGVIQVWHEGRIRAGESWADVIRNQIQNADIVILLISADFLASDFVWGHELALVLQRQRQGKATVIPVIVRPCLWEDSPLAAFQALPSDGKPVSLSPNPDRTWLTVARQIEEVARNIRSAA
jgi:TIR domain